MGSIYKRTRRDKKKGKIIEGDIYWVSCYRDGKQFRDSANTSSMAEAKGYLANKEGDIATGIPVTPKI